MPTALSLYRQRGSRGWTRRRCRQDAVVVFVVVVVVVAFVAGGVGVGGGGDVVVVVHSGAYHANLWHDYVEKQASA